MNMLTTRNHRAATRYDDWFDHMFRPLNLAGFTKKYDHYVTEIDVPGFGKGDLDLTVKEGVIFVSGKKENRSLYHEILIPEHADIDMASAETENGILRISIPVLEDAKPKRIEVK
jgi:HSP20 family protein